MKTPGLDPFLQSVGRTVHNLNTIVVGLSGVENSSVTKPESLDISWSPTNLLTSARSARAFSLQSSIVFVSEALDSYVNVVSGAPGMQSISKLKDGKKAEKFHALVTEFSLNEVDIAIGPLLLIHWRNRIVHPKSKAGLTKEQSVSFSDASCFLAKSYKGLDPTVTLQNFNKSTPSLKDASSLIAMTINSVKAIDALVPAPKSRDDLLNWLRHLGLLDGLRRTQKKPSKNSDRSVHNYFSTNCPQLLHALSEYGV